MDKKEIKRIVEKIIHAEVDRRAEEEICSPGYYKNEYLKKAMMENTSLQCIVREYAKMLKSGAKFSKSPADDMFHANQLVSYLVIYTNKNLLKVINDYFVELEESTQDYFSHLIADLLSRLKAFFSLEIKIRLMLLKKEAIPYVKENLRNMSLWSGLIDEVTLSVLTTFTEEDFELAEEVLDELYDKNLSKEPTRDIVGYRIVMRSVNTSTDEKVLTESVYTYRDFVVDFFAQKGFITVLQKDYIKFPKEDTNYQSLHLVIIIAGIPIELQLRTAEMDWFAEEGPAAHDNFYKNTVLYKFFKEFLYKVSSDKDRLNTKLNEAIGFLKEKSLDKRTWCFTPDHESPKTPAELTEYYDIEFIKKLWEVSSSTT